MCDNCHGLMFNLKDLVVAYSNNILSKAKVTKSLIFSRHFFCYGNCGKLRA